LGGRTMSYSCSSTRLGRSPSPLEERLWPLATLDDGSLFVIPLLVADAEVSANGKPLKSDRLTRGFQFR
jgi:hypothetical protein